MSQEMVFPEIVSRFERVRASNGRSLHVGNGFPLVSGPANGVTTNPTT